LKSVKSHYVTDHFSGPCRPVGPVCVSVCLKVKFNPAHEFLGEFDTSALLRAYFTASAVRVVLVQPAYTRPLLSYYAVVSLSVDGHCQCYGHANRCLGLVRTICLLLATAQSTDDNDQRVKRLNT